MLARPFALIDHCRATPSSRFSDEEVAMTVLPSRLTPLAALALVLGCAPEVGDLPSEPAATAALDAASGDDGGPRFSDWTTPTHLGTVVNSRQADFDPFLSKDELSLYFAAGNGRGGQGGRDIWVARRTSSDAPWGAPVNLGAPVNSASNDAKPTLSVDGHRLYFTSNRPGGGGFDVYVSRRRDKRDDLGWEAPVNLGSGVNSSASEESAISLVEDDETGAATLYFASNRAGLGDFDIYSATLLPDGTFGAAVLVEELSSARGDIDPSVRRDGRELFLASNRPGTNGGYDLWVSTRGTMSEPWSAPVNLGLVVNSAPRPIELEQANDFRPNLSFDGTTLHFGSPFRAENVSEMLDLWVTTRQKVRGPG
jgi:hypothetical protein